jgi:hypothetical protein
MTGSTSVSPQLLRKSFKPVAPTGDQNEVMAFPREAFREFCANPG